MLLKFEIVEASQNCVRCLLVVTRTVLWQFCTMYQVIQYPWILVDVLCPPGPEIL